MFGVPLVWRMLPDTDVQPTHAASPEIVRGADQSSLDGTEARADDSIIAEKSNVRNQNGESKRSSPCPPKSKS